MTPILYTDTDKIRGVLGVTDNDLTDEQLVDRDLERELSVDLDIWVANHANIYQDGLAVSATSAEVKAFDLLVMYCKYFCALLVARSALALAAPQTVSDGKNSMGRFTPFDLRRLQDELAGKVTSLKQALNQTTGMSSTPASPFTQFAAVQPAYDPVVGGDR